MSSGIAASQTFIIYRQMIEASTRGKVHAEAHVWCINTPVLNFSTVEWYNDDRVMRKFGCRQFVLVEPQQFAYFHSKTMRGKHTTDWSVEHQCYVALWNARYDRCGSQPMGELEDQYMAEPDSEDQPLKTSDQWISAFCDES
ncbi:hypothetical protein PVK06_020382 [Gossypium arboreum]|uniref:Uncharacterized protein n=1 Tax=Gossypium arboreum TaxID=29729 RepID=A0ABR0PMF5_GOSAR|nr:hypothetical protein PVK06_020382 [Gossypium arboreum]